MAKLVWDLGDEIKKEDLVKGLNLYGKLMAKMLNGFAKQVENSKGDEYVVSMDELMKEFEADIDKLDEQ